MYTTFVRTQLKIVCVGFLLLISYVFFTSSAEAISSLSGASNATSSVGAALPITDIQIIGNAASTTPVKLVVSNGTLSITNTEGLSALSGTTGSTITFTATVADANAALATLTYTRGGAGTGLTSSYTTIVYRERQYSNFRYYNKTRPAYILIS